MIKELLVLTAAVGCLACGQPDRTGAGEGEGRVAFRADTRVHSATGAIPAVCATFTLTPYALDANGSWIGPAGAAMSVTSGKGPATAAILGCTASGHGTDWGYLVTATGFNDCAGASIAGLSPSVVSTRQTLTCVPGQDVPVNIAVDVSIAAPNNTGYIDISTTVEVTSVSVGCKNADIDDAGLLHFGETSLSASAAGVTAPLGFTSISLAANGVDQTIPAEAVRQFAGLIDGAGQKGPFYTGLLSLALPGAYDVLQTFAQACPVGQYYSATQAPTCETSVAASPRAASTSALLADAFVLVPGALWVSAQIKAPASVALAWGTAAALSDPNRPPVTAWNPQRRSTITFSAPLAGLYVDQRSPGGLWALVSPASPLSGPEVQQVSYDLPSGQWRVASRGPLSALPPAALASMGLFQQLPAGCRKQVQ